MNRETEVDTLSEYFEALERLVKNKPIRVPAGTRICNDSVSLEAGRGKGCIKRSRPVFARLIAAIEAAAGAQPGKKVVMAAKARVRAERYKSKLEDLQAELDASLAREVSLLSQLLDARRRIEALTGEGVIPFPSARACSEE